MDVLYVSRGRSEGREPCFPAWSRLEVIQVAPHRQVSGWEDIISIERQRGHALGLQKMVNERNRWPKNRKTIVETVLNLLPTWS